MEGVTCAQAYTVGDTERYGMTMRKYSFTCVQILFPLDGEVVSEK